MQVTFYNMSSSLEVVNKTKTTIKSVDCEAYEGFTEEDPIMIVARDDSLLSANYMYISSTNRYYFCKVRILNGRKMSITGHTDVISTFYDNYKNCPCIIDRTSDTSLYNKDITDDLILQNLQTTMTEVNLNTETNVSSPFNYNPESNNSRFIILTLKGRSETPQ